MKLNIAYPQYRSQKVIDIDDEKKVRIFYDKRISEEVAVDTLGPEFQGYVFKITGGHDKQGFGMKQGVLLNTRTRLLLDGSTSHYTPKRDGARKRKSVRGCIVASDISSLNLIIVKRGTTDLPGLTDAASDKPSTRGPKRANHIRKVWGLSKTEDVRKYVVRRKIPGKDGKPDRYKSPKIQRLITPTTRYRKKARLALKKKRHEKSLAEAAEYEKLLAQKRNQARATLLSKKREAKSERKSIKVDPKEVSKAVNAKKVASKAKKEASKGKTIVVEKHAATSKPPAVAKAPGAPSTTPASKLKATSATKTSVKATAKPANVTSGKPKKQ